jgi:hypothetical protein
MKVVLHGFGSFPIVFWHMIQYARSIDASIEWAIILTTDHHRDLFVSLLGPDRVAVLDQYSEKSFHGISELVYPGSLYRDLEADKRAYKYAPAAQQQVRAMSLYLQVRDFMRRFEPTHALVSQVEGFDGKVFIATARERGIEVVVPTSCRNLGGIFFSPNDVETLPVYADHSNEHDRLSARVFVDSFRKNPKPARWNPEVSNDELLDSFVSPFRTRTLAAARRWLITPGGFQWDYLRASLLNNLPFIRDQIWNFRRRLNEDLCDIRSLDKLPRRFIFYPLQYTPESSINTPAAYFLDQFRAIDAIRYAMPSDCLLVVKEHPACILLRGGTFVKQLQHTSGVLVAHYGLSSLDLLKRAALTISVTGTATLEALLLGRPAIALGGTLVSEMLGGVCSLGDLEYRIACNIDRNIQDAEVIKAIATIFNVRHEVAFGSPGVPGEPVLRRGNIERLTQAFFKHCRLVDRGGGMLFNTATRKLPNTIYRDAGSQTLV